MSERSIVRHSKCRVRQGPWVRIPLSPPRRKPEPLVGSGFCVVWSKDAGIRTRKGHSVKRECSVNIRVAVCSRRPSGEPQNGRFAERICVNPTCQLKENAERRDENPKGPNGPVDRLCPSTLKRAQDGMFVKQTCENPTLCWFNDKVKRRDRDSNEGILHRYYI